MFDSYLAEIGDFCRPDHQCEGGQFGCRELADVKLGGKWLCDKCIRLHPAGDCKLEQGDDVTTSTGRTGMIVDGMDDDCRFLVSFYDGDQMEWWDFDLLTKQEEV